MLNGRQIFNCKFVAKCCVSIAISSAEVEWLAKSYPHTHTPKNEKISFHINAMQSNIIYKAICWSYHMKYACTVYLLLRWAAVKAQWHRLLILIYVNHFIISCNRCNNRNKYEYNEMWRQYAFLLLLLWFTFVFSFVLFYFIFVFCWFSFIRLSFYRMIILRNLKSFFSHLSIYRTFKFNYLAVSSNLYNVYRLRYVASPCVLLLLIGVYRLLNCILSNLYIGYASKNSSIKLIVDGRHFLLGRCKVKVK